MGRIERHRRACRTVSTTESRNFQDVQALERGEGSLGMTKRSYQIFSCWLIRSAVFSPLHPTAPSCPRWGPRSNHGCRRLYQMEATPPVPCPPAVTATRRAPPSLPLRPSLGGPERAPENSSRLLLMIGSLPLAVLVLFEGLASKHRAVAWLLPGEDGIASGLVSWERELYAAPLRKDEGGGNLRDWNFGRKWRSRWDPSVQVDVTSPRLPPPPRWLWVA